MSVDTEGHPLTPLRVERAQNLNIVAGCLGICWAIALFPQGTIVTLYLSEELDASFSQIGWIAAVTSLSSLLQLAGVLLFNRLKTRKKLWVTCNLVGRSLGLILAASAFYVAFGGRAQAAAGAVIWASAATMVLANLAAVGWWGWMADLVPESRRGQFFGRRQAIMTFVQMIFFILVAVGLDALRARGGVGVFGAIFVLGTLMGVTDIAIHSRIPEPARADVPEGRGLRHAAAQMIEPLRNRNFVLYLLALSLWVFATTIAGPFIAPYLKASSEQNGLGLPYSFFAVLNVIASLCGLLTSRPWGVVADRFGNKPIVQITALAHAVLFVYFFITPGNAYLVLSVATLVSGTLVAGWALATGNMMLGLAPVRNRSSYLAVHAAFVGLGGFLGPGLGGWLGDWAVGYLEHHPWVLPSGQPMAPIHLLIAASWFYCLLVYPIFAAVREPRAKPVGYVMTRLTGGNLFRTFSSLNTISSNVSARKKAGALRRIGGQSDVLVVEDVLARLDDPDEDVRREAALALGRIGSAEAVDALLERLTDPESDIKTAAAAALGMIKDPRALGPLMEALGNSDREIRRAAALALGESRARDAVSELRRILESDPEPRVFVAALRALTMLGETSAAWDVLPRMRETRNPVLRRELALSVADLVGSPGEFYRILHEENRVPGSQVQRLLRRLRRCLCDTIGSKDPRAREPLRRLIDEGIAASESDDRPTLAAALWKLFLTVLRHDYGYDALHDDLALSFAAKTDLRLGIGASLIYQLRGRSREGGGDGLLDLDFLLAAYFLAAEAARRAGAA